MYCGVPCAMLITKAAVSRHSIPLYSGACVAQSNSLIFSLSRQCAVVWNVVFSYNCHMLIMGCIYVGPTYILRTAHLAGAVHG